LQNAHITVENLFYPWHKENNRSSESGPFLKIFFIFKQNLLMLTQVFASAVFGIEAQPIVIEVHIDKGIGYHLVGLPDNAVKESN
jgi:hypothetical protein